MATEVSILFCGLWSRQKLVHSDVVELRVVQFVLIILKQIFYSQVYGWNPLRLQLGTRRFQASELNIFLYTCNGAVLWAP